MSKRSRARKRARKRHIPSLRIAQPSEQFTEKSIAPATESIPEAIQPEHQQEDRVMSSTMPEEQGSLDLNLNLQMIPTSALRIPIEYQRRIDWNRVRSFIRDFDIELFSPLDVSMRSDGLYYVMDGQHHFLAGESKGADEMPCIVHYGLTIPEEAAFFRAKNSCQRPPSPAAHFNAAITQGDPQIVELKEAFDQLGIQVSKRRGANNVTAIGEIMRLVNLYDTEIVGSAFLCAVSAWPDSPSNCSVDVIGGLCEFVAHYGDTVRMKRFSERLGSVELAMICKQFNRKMIEHNMESHRSTPIKRKLMCRFMVDVFNKGLRRSGERLNYVEEA
jgi:hypothetical protein